MRPMLTLFCGPPGSGKSTLSRELEAAGVGVRICTDDWQDVLGVDPRDGDFHERLQVELYRHALRLLERGVDVILEDGLWMRAERTQKFADARARGARISWHVFEVSAEELWRRVDRRNVEARAGAVPLTRDELQRAVAVFEPPTDAELASVDEYVIHR